MKKGLIKILCGVLLFSMTASAVPVYAEEAANSDNPPGESPVAETFNEDNINPEYKDWVSEGKKGPAPMFQDMSYLYDSYSNMPALYSSLPDKFDLRESGSVEPVYDQGEYGYCWTVAANVAASSPILNQFPHKSFSPVHTAWFSYTGNEEEEYINVMDPYKYGGYNPLAVGTMAAWKGPVNRDAVPEDPYNEGNPDESTRFRADYHLQDSYYLPVGTFDDSDYSSDEQLIPKQLIMEKGALSMKFKADEECFNYETSSWYNKDSDYSDHQVVVVGWDDNYPRTNFMKGKRPSENGAWLARNSWGTDWGDDGYFWISYEDKTMGISSTYLLEDNDNYSKNYQYDTMGWSFSVSPDLEDEENKTGTAANIFRAEGNELLEAVSFYTTDTGTDYNISVYTDVKKGKPESGTQILTQEGSESYPGYHTIELEKPVKLSKDSRFSIVVEFTNPQYPYAIPVEMFIDGYYGQIPEYLGNGGESYIKRSGKWMDLAGDVDGFYVTNACIKGFTNPVPESNAAVPSVKFSELEGPVADGTELELEAYGGDEIYYSVNGGEYKLYSGPVSLKLPGKNDTAKVSAYAVTDGKKGNITEKEYTKAAAQLTDLAIDDNWDKTHLDTESENTYHMFISEHADSLSVMAQSCDDIYINGEPVKSADWIDLSPMKKGEEKEILITVKGEGKETTEYRIYAYKDVISIDFVNETLSYDESRYTLKDADGNIIKSGDSLTPYISETDNVYFTLETATGGSYEYVLPGRFIIDSVPIDYKHERTRYIYEQDYIYSYSPDMKDSIRCKDNYIKVEPGKDFYLQLPANEYHFAGNIFHVKVPDRKEAPVVKAEKITDTSVRLKEYKHGRYSMDGKKWSEKPLFKNLEPDTEYEFHVRTAATKKAFASETGTAEITTLKKPLVVAGKDDKNKPDNKPDKETDKKGGNRKDADSKNSPGTGDSTDLLLWMMLLASSGTSVYVIKKKFS